ncbi:MAG: serine/threonine protein kinase [Planctomycetota bacterium]|nr:MAG: serine/threonine protein kinase [Planctomycetota bacterium]
MPYVDDELFGNTTASQGLLGEAELKELRRRQAELRRSGITKSLFALSCEEGILDDDSLLAISDEADRLSINHIPGYDIKDRIGAGGMGTVYRALQRSLRKTVALKVLPPQLAENEQFVQRFLREAKSQAKLNHPNVVQVLDAGEAAGVYYFAMEYVEGDTCAKIVRKTGPMGEKRALDIAIQIVKALEHAEKHGLVHRDIKPDNIMLTPDGIAKLCDLGLVKTTNADSKLTVQGIAMGTPHYISPEQARGRVDIDIRADVYSLGITLYYIMTGRLPFKGKTPGEVMRKHISELFRIPKNIFSKMSGGIARVILKMTAKDPNDRYQSTSELRKDLELARNGQPPLLANSILLKEAIAPEEETDEGAQPSRNIMRLLVCAAIGAVALIIIILLLVYLIGGRATGYLPDRLGQGKGGSGGTAGISSDITGAGRTEEIEAELRRKREQEAKKILNRAHEITAGKDLFLEEIISRLKKLLSNVEEGILLMDDEAELEALIAGLEADATEDFNAMERKIQESKDAVKAGRFRESMELLAVARVNARTEKASKLGDRYMAKLPVLIRERYMEAREAAVEDCRYRKFADARTRLDLFRSTGIKSLDEAARKDYEAIRVADESTKNRKEALNQEDKEEKAAEAVLREIEKTAEKKYEAAKKLLDSRDFLRAADAFESLDLKYGNTAFMEKKRAEIDLIRPRRGLVIYITRYKQVTQVFHSAQTGIKRCIALDFGTFQGEFTVTWEGYMVIDKTARTKFMAYTTGKPTLRIGSITMRFRKMTGQEDAYEMKKAVTLSKSSMPRKVFARVTFSRSDEKRVIFARWDVDDEHPVPLDMGNCYYLPGQVPRVGRK